MYFMVSKTYQGMNRFKPVHHHATLPGCPDDDDSHEMMATGLCRRRTRRTLGNGLKGHGSHARLARKIRTTAVHSEVYYFFNYM